MESVKTLIKQWDIYSGEWILNYQHNNSFKLPFFTQKNNERIFLKTQNYITT